MKADQQPSSIDEATSRYAPRPSRLPTAPKPTGRQRLLDAAGRLFATRGFLDVSAAEISREAGVAHGLLFHHFGSMADLYAEVSRAAAAHMDDMQLAAFRGKTAREQIRSFLRAHIKAVKQREGDAIFRARSDAGDHHAVAQIWEASRQRAIDKLCQVLGIQRPDKRVRVCLRAWIGFHDQLVLGWLADRSLSEADVIDWSLRQLEQLAADVLNADLDRSLQRG